MRAIIFDFDGLLMDTEFVALERVRDADLVLSSASQLRLADALSQLS